MLLLGAAGSGLAQRIGCVPPMPVGRPPSPAAVTAQAPAAGRAAAAPAPTPPKEWTGESGSSGHPLMQASAIRAAAANFESCLEGLWPLAAKRNISRASFDKYVARPDARSPHHGSDGRAAGVHQGVLGLSRHPGERSRASPAAARCSPSTRPIFDKVEKAYGVDRHIITAIWGVESNYGTLGGDRPVLRSTATLACVGRRQAYFRDEFLSALEILHRGDLTPGAAERLLGRRVRSDAVHADVVQALRRRLRRRRPPRCRQLGSPI